MLEPSRAAELRIRPLEERDLPGLEWDGEYRHFRAVFRSNFDDMRKGHRWMLVAAQGDTLVGQIFIQYNSADRHYADGSRRGYLYALRVRPAWRGQGLGRRLVQAAEEHLARRGYRMAVIAVAKTNERARSLYLRLGYRAFGDDPGIWAFTDADGREQRMEEPAWLMEKALAAGAAKGV